MFATKVNNLSSASVLPMMNICVNITLRQVLKAKKVKRSSLPQCCKSTSKMRSVLSATIIKGTCQTTSLFTEMVLATP
jgi:hypothetical protein